jgi:hypothetical protein
VQAIKNPLKGGLISRFAILSPPDPYRTALKMLHAYSASLLNILKNLLPCFNWFCFKSGHSDCLDLLNCGRSNEALDATAD